MFKKIILIIVVVAVAGFLLIQLVPYGRDHTNPPVVQEPNWDSPATRELASRACFDCHSNETVWPWYSNIAPASWLVARDTYEARDYLNFSDWLPGDIDLEDVAEVIREGEMPPPQYKLIHAGARLTDAERQQLLQGLQNSLQ
jgi:hypothetical protein